MRKTLIILVSLILLFGCSSSKQFPMEENTWNTEAPLTMEDIQNQSREEIVLDIPEPLLEVSSLEAMMLTVEEFW